MYGKSGFHWLSGVGRQEKISQENIYEVSMLICAQPQGYILSLLENGVGEYAHWYKNFLLISKWLNV